MITKSIIRNAIQANVIQFVVDPNMESGTVCQIGDNWFYFGGMTAEDMTPQEYLEAIPMDDIISEVFDALEGFRQESEAVENDYEYAYYEAYLKEHLSPAFFANDIETHVPTCCLIEVYQTLLAAAFNLDFCNYADAKDNLHVAMDCIAEEIDRYTKVPAEYSIKPSVSSLINMSDENGIILAHDGKDISCAAGKPVSHAMSGGCCQCTEECMKQHQCNPEHGVMQLQNGFRVHVTASAESEHGLDAMTKSLFES